MQEQERMWHLLALYLSGEASAEELKELQTIADAEPEFKTQLNILTKLWQAENPGDINEIESAWNKHILRIK